MSRLIAEIALTVRWLIAIAHIAFLSLRGES